MLEQNVLLLTDGRMDRVSLCTPTQTDDINNNAPFKFDDTFA